MLNVMPPKPHLKANQTFITLHLPYPVGDKADMTNALNENVVKHTYIKDGMIELFESY